MAFLEDFDKVCFTRSLCDARNRMMKDIPVIQEFILPTNVCDVLLNHEQRYVAVQPLNYITVVNVNIIIYALSPI